MVNILRKSRVLALALAFMLITSNVVYAAPDVQPIEAVSGEFILEGIDDLSYQIVAEGDTTITVRGTNSISNITCSGNLTIVGDSSDAKLFVSNNSNSSEYMTSYPGIIANGSITVRDISIEDSSLGVAISDASGSFGGLVFDNSSVHIHNTGNRLYGIVSSESISINSSYIEVESGYTVCGLFAFGEIVSTNSNIRVSNDGIYSFAAGDAIELDEGQEIKYPENGSIMPFNDSIMFAVLTDIRLIGVDGTIVDSDIQIGIIPTYEVFVLHGSASYEKGYAGELVTLEPDTIDGKKFVKWVTTSDIELSDETSASATFTMPEFDVTVEAIYEDIIEPVIDLVSDSSANITSESSADVTSDSSADVVSDSSADVVSNASSDIGHGESHPEHPQHPEHPDHPKHPQHPEHPVTPGNNSNGGAAGGGSGAAGGGAVDEPVPPLDDNLDANTPNPADDIPEVNPNPVDPNLQIPNGTAFSAPLKDKKGRDIGKAEFTISKSGKLRLASIDSVNGKVSVPNFIEVNGSKVPVTGISPNAFKGDKALKRVELGKNVASIGKNAFSNCKNLKVITISGKITSVGKGAFKGVNKKLTIKLSGSSKACKATKKAIKNSDKSKSFKFVVIK